tara:strand:+ start:53370 stop:54296 length:927 start_codon:yes stop_codon:yes gene_type:complete
MSKKWSELSIGEIRRRQEGQPKNPMYAAIDLITDDMKKYVKDNFDFDKNIYNLGSKMFSYLKYRCNNVLEYFKDYTLIINLDEGPFKVRIDNIPGDIEDHLSKTYFEPNDMAMSNERMNFACLLNDSLIFLRDLNGEVSPQFIRDHLIKTYNINPNDLKELPYEERKEFVRKKRFHYISFQDSVPYGPIEIKNTNKEYNIQFFSGAIDHLSELLDIPEDLKKEMKEVIFSPDQNRRLGEILCLNENKQGKSIRARSVTDDDLHLILANCICRFFFYALGDAPDSRYIKVRKKLEPYYLNYLNNRKSVA